MPSKLAISSSGLHGAHRRVAALSSLLVGVDVTCINSFTPTGSDMSPVFFELRDLIITFLHFVR
jgi:hypothetical protein